MKQQIKIKLHIYNSGEELVKEYTHCNLLFLGEKLDMADGNQTIVVGSIGKIAEDLKNQRDIIRCHRNIIANLCNVKYPNKDYSELILITGERIPVSSSKRKIVKDRLTHYTDYFFKLMEDE